MVNLSLNELKTIAKFRGIKGYKSISEERLLSVLNNSESAKESEKNFDDARIEKIKKYFHKLRYRFSKQANKQNKKKRLEKTFTEQKTKRIFLYKKLKRLKKIFLSLRSIMNIIN